MGTGYCLPPKVKNPPRSIKITENSCTVSWQPIKVQNVQGEIYYQVEIMKFTDPNAQILRAVTKNQFEFKELEPSTQYSVRVRVVAPLGGLELKGEFSPSCKFTTKETDVRK